MTNVRADFDPDIPMLSVETPIDHNFHQTVNDKILRWESTLPAEYWEYRREWEENPKNRVVGPFPILPYSWINPNEVVEVWAGATNNSQVGLLVWR